MRREERFNFRLDEEDRRQLAAVARWLERKESDAVRWLIRQAYRELEAGIETRQGGKHDPRLAR